MDVGMRQASGRNALQMFSQPCFDFALAGNGIVVKERPKAGDVERQFFTFLVAQQYGGLAHAMGIADLIKHIR